ncbi:MAG: hypothetical protein LC790_01135 [Actinobacteria bacterium]|nr:hypothetical protein [Actinomycetota bacterium]
MASAERGTRGHSGETALTGASERSRGQGFEPPLLERERELAVLADAVARAREGEGSLVVVEANAGLGKSRLLAEGRALARVEDARVLSGPIRKYPAKWRSGEAGSPLAGKFFDVRSGLTYRAVRRP